MLRTVTALTLLICAALSTGCLIITGFGSSARSEMDEVILVEPDRRSTSEKILVIDISGTISNEKSNGLFSPGTSMLEDVHDSLNLAREDSDVVAVIIRINSPGGGITPSDQIHGEIQQFAEDTDLPVIAMMMDVAASGGYYIACATDQIAALPTTITGSIGVVMVSVDVTGLENIAGVQVEAITSGPYKDTLSPFRRMRTDERELMEGMIDEMYELFLSKVIEARVTDTVTAEMLRERADGRIYTAQQALNAGLIDEIITLPGLVDEIKADLDLSDVRVVSHRRNVTGDHNIYAQTPTEMSVNLSGIGPLIDQLRPGLHWVWLPGVRR